MAMALLLWWIAIGATVVQGFNWRNLGEDHRLRRAYEALSEAKKSRVDRLLAHTPPDDASSIQLDQGGSPFYVEAVRSTTPFQFAPATTTSPAATSPAAGAGIPIYHSLPGSTNIIYLDFDGEVITGTSWSTEIPLTTITARAFSLDSDRSTFNTQEARYIRDIWERVSEDYSPWDVDVTTELPSAWTSTTLHAVITYGDSSMPYGTSSGGVAYVGIFDIPETQFYSPAFVYYNQLGSDPKSIGEATSHEIGHNLGLSHDGATGGTEYYGGSGSGATSWAPIMGVSYYKTITQFSKGEYANANNKEDDMQMIGDQLGFVDKTIALAEQKKAGCTVYLYGSGVIQSETDEDTWNVDLIGSASSVTITAVPYLSTISSTNSLYNGNNLDILLRFGATTSAPVGVSTASINAGTVAAGSYTVSVSGSAETYFTKYASVGQYSLGICIVYNPFPCTVGDCCNTATGFTKPKDTLCATPTELCGNNSYCDGISPDCPVVYKPETAVCRPATSSCDAAEYCDGISNTCPEDLLSPATTLCRPATTVCDVDDYCTGLDATCPTDAFAEDSTVCRIASTICDVTEYCTGTSSVCPRDVFAPATTVCRDATELCDIEEKCTGSSATCPADAKQPSSYICRKSADVCDVAEKCTGASIYCPADTFQPTSTVCRAAVSTCDVLEKCTGSSSACPVDLFASSTTVCRASVSVCDVAETCTGLSSVCPDNAFADTTTVCRAATGVCDAIEYCTGASSTCPTNGYLAAGTVCRSAGGDCDIEEMCSGSSASCPSDVKRPSTYVCRPAAGGCDIAEKCTGTAVACPIDKVATSTTVCRSAVSVCDVAEKCDGSTVNCPPDQFAVAGGLCRSAATGGCDVADYCTGDTGTCPNLFADSSKVCRAATGACDAIEYCTGASATCPANKYLAAGTVCRSATGDCDIEEKCSGSSASCPSDAKRSSKDVCRPAVGGCDVAEKCTGTSKLCPDDLFKTGTCTTDGGTTGTCSNGVCL
eukprot:TRINITY_DN14667_c0_g1_i1.p1 TRINITY_DN14667_c0_g1~~TRINITY_DN14667_c0_g1_i1.p1  ORF type:complete len:996 (+),score=154.10 TRINITY_DN14667_c0_g1_i1:103-3090(+)